MAVAELIEKPHLLSDIQKQIQETEILTEEVLDDGRLMRGRYVARTRTVKEGFLSLADIRCVLGKPGWNPRIAGGITGIPESDYQKLVESMA